MKNHACTDLSITVTAGSAPGVRVVHLVGEVDVATRHEVGPAVLEVADQATTGLVLDLSRVGFFGSAGIALLLDAQQAADRLGIGFAVVAHHRAVVNPLRVTEVDATIAVRATLDDAVTAARERRPRRDEGSRR
ncbi:STAS domain-containing protein [Actinosynnema sp. NPDC091369]